jgi:hypothetical protein
MPLVGRPLGLWIGSTVAIAIAATVGPSASLAGEADCFDYGGDILHSTGRVSLPGSHSVALSGDLAYVAAETGIVIIDHSNPAEPVIIGGTPTIDLVTNIVVSGGYAYLPATDFMGVPESSLLVYSLSDPIAPTRLAKVAIRGYAGSLAMRENLAFVTSSSPNRLTVINVANPIAPTVIGELALSYLAPKIAVSGTHAYLSRGALGGMQVIDVSNPSAPFPVPGGTLETGDFTYSIAADEPYVYLPSGLFKGEGKLRVIDVSNPGDPVEVGSVITEGEPGAVLIHDQIVFATDLHAINGPPPHLYAIDVHDPKAPRIVGQVPAHGNGRSIDLQGNRLVAAFIEGVAGPPGVQVFDVTGHVTPLALSGIDIPGLPVDMSVGGNVACITTRFAGLQIVEIGDPTQLVGTLSLPGEGIAVAMTDNLAFVGSSVGSSSALHVVDIGDPASPMEAGVTIFEPGINDLAAAGRHVFAACDRGLRVFDVTNPSAPLPVGFADAPGLAMAVAVSENQAYVGCWNDETYEAELAVFDVSIPASPALIGQALIIVSSPPEDPYDVLDVAISGAHVYISGRIGLSIFAVSSPALPQLIREVAIADGAQAVEVLPDQTMAYAVGNGLNAIDISSPENATLLGAAALPFGSKSVATYGDIVLVTTQVGLWLLPGQCPAVAGQSEAAPPLALGSGVLKAVHPNPFARTTSITIDLPGTETVELTIHDVAGRWVRTLVDGKLGAGRHAREWDGRAGSGESLANGVYFLRLMHSGGTVETRALTLLR